MPWHETDPMDQRCKFVMGYLSGQFEMTELCRSYGITRPTGYKWVKRYRTEGAPGLQERSRAPRHCPHQMSQQIAQWLLSERRAHPSWGPRKLLRRFINVHSRSRAPSRAAVAALLHRYGLSERRGARRFASTAGRPVARPSAPNELWTLPPTKANFSRVTITGVTPSPCETVQVAICWSAEHILASVARAPISACSGFSESMVCPMPSTAITGALREHWPGRSVAYLGALAKARDQTRTLSPRLSTGQRCARAYASHAEGRDDAPRGCESACSAAPLQSLPTRVQSSTSP